MNLIARKSVLSGNIFLLPLFLRESFTGLIRFLIDHDFSFRALNVSSHYFLVLMSFPINQLLILSSLPLIISRSYFSLAALKFFSLCLSAVLILVCLFVDHFAFILHGAHLSFWMCKLMFSLKLGVFNHQFLFMLFCISPMLLAIPFHVYWYT